MRAMARFFWFTIEFGLMQSKDGLRVYGSGLLSSYGEIQHALESPDVQRYPIQLEWAINQGFEIDRYQPLLYWVESFDHLFSLVDPPRRALVHRPARRRHRRGRQLRHGDGHDEDLAEPVEVTT